MENKTAMTPEQIEAEAIRLYCTPYGGKNSHTYAFIDGANFCQPEINALKERVKELDKAVDNLKKFSVKKPL